MRTFKLADLPTYEVYQLLVGAIAPRPIAFVSTLDAEGNPNLAPYSFFNAFSSNPPILVFSSNRRTTDNSTKDTLNNLQKTGEVVINMVNYAIVRQMTISSIEFGATVNEFEQAGLTPLASELVQPFRVKESPIQLECRVQEITPLGKEGGAGHLVICELLCMHIREDILGEKNRIDPHKADLMGRMGRSYYVRASGEAIHSIYQSIMKPCIGYPNLPKSIRESNVLTGNDIGRLAGLLSPPSTEAITATRQEVTEILNSDTPLISLHERVRFELQVENIDFAAALAWLGEELSGSYS